ncbi:hypothetical protein Q5752_002926 [Cryptotrichosporon argae]
MPTPLWVYAELQKLLGLDDETIKEAIVPSFDGQANETRLRGYLEDFLGSTPAAKAFTDRYVALRFPPRPAPAPTAVAAPARAAPAARPASQTLPSSFKPKPPPGLARPPPPHLQPQPHGRPPAVDLTAVNAAFGPGGKVYQKQGGDMALRRGGSGSGSQTPRQAGAFSMHEARRAGSGSGSGHAREASAQGKKADKIWDAPKSKETLRLEGIIDKLREVQEGSGKVAVDGVPCFCQARVHALSAYTPHCPTCGLVLCAQHQPHAPCPSCGAALYTSSALARLILRVQAEADAQAAREQATRDERERARLARLAAESGGGAFPTLPGAAPVQPPGPAQRQERKVLSLSTVGGKNAKGKAKATITTTTYRAPSPVRDAEGGHEGPEDDVADVIARPRSPPMEYRRIEKEIAEAASWRKEADRPWGDPKAEKKGTDKLAYVEKTVVALIPEEGRRKKAKQKGLGVDGRKVVGAA